MIYNPTRGLIVVAGNYCDIEKGQLNPQWESLIHHSANIRRESNKNETERDLVVYTYIDDTEGVPAILERAAHEEGIPPESIQVIGGKSRRLTIEKSLAVLLEKGLITPESAVSFLTERDDRDWTLTYATTYLMGRNQPKVRCLCYTPEDSETPEKRGVRQTRSTLRTLLSRIIGKITAVQNL
jgi:hypothetical protein